MTKVIFKRGTLKDNIYIIKKFYSDKEENIKFLYPNINKESIERTVTKYYDEKVLDENVKKYNAIWKENKKDYFEYITNYLNVSLDTDITCYVLNIPVFPRNLSNNTFYIGINLDSNFMCDTVKHEVLHFYWFKKFKSIYKDIDRKMYDAPYLPWMYSEMVVDPILGLKAYPEFYKNDDIYKLREIYSKNISIEDKIREGYEYLKKKHN